MDLKDPISGLDFANPRHLAFLFVMAAIPLSIILVRWYTRHRAKNAALVDMLCRKHNFVRDLETFVAAAVSLSTSERLTTEKFELLSKVCSEAASTAQGFAVRSEVFDPSLTDEQHELDFSYLNARSEELFKASQVLNSGYRPNAEHDERMRVHEQFKIHASKLDDLQQKIEVGHGYLQGLQRGYPTYPSASIQQDLADAEVLLNDVRKLLSSTNQWNQELRRLRWLAGDIQSMLHRIGDLTELPKIAFAIAESTKAWAEKRLQEFVGRSDWFSALLRTISSKYRSTTLVDLKTLHRQARALHAEALAASKTDGTKDWQKIKRQVDLAMDLIELGSRVCGLSAQDQQALFSP